MIDTPEFKRFNETSEPPRNYKEEKELLRQQLQADTERFLQAGGAVQQIDHRANRNPQFGLGTMHSVVPGRQISL